MERVLNTPELLELILGSVDPRTLLTSATRVCRHWHTLIRLSIEVQRALFLWPEKHSASPGPRSNPLLSPHIIRLFLSQPEALDPRGPAQEPEDYAPPRGFKFIRGGAAWGRMLVQQPPATRIGIWRVDYSSRDLHHVFEEADLTGDGGLTMGQLLDLTLAWIEKGYTWKLFWGARMKSLFEKERRSLMVLKVGASVQASLLELRDNSHAIVKLTRWNPDP